MKIIFGTVEADFKYLKLDDEIISRGYLSRNIAYLPQHNFVPKKLTVSIAMDIFCKNYREELLKIQFVVQNLNKKFRDFSGGESRFLEALIIIYSDAKFILLDEPFSQLAPLLIEELKQHINHLKKYKGFIITDHYYQSILDVSDRIVLLHNGCNYKINNIDDLILHDYLPDFRE